MPVLFCWYIAPCRNIALKRLSRSNFKNASLFMFYTPFFHSSEAHFIPSFFHFFIPAQRMWCLIFHTKSTENTDKKRLVRRVGMEEINVNNTHNFIHKSSFPKHGLTRLGGFFHSSTAQFHFLIFFGNIFFLFSFSSNFVPLQYLNLKLIERLSAEPVQQKQGFRENCSSPARVKQ